MTVTAYEYHKVSNTITANNNYIVANGATVTFNAGKKIILGPYFRAENGSNFHAYILGCNSGSGPQCKTNGVNANNGMDERYNFNEVQPSEISYTNTFTVNFPNPFHTTTNITYTIMEKQPVTIIVKDVMGQEVARPLNNEVQDMGCYKLAFDASGLSHGIYFYTLQTATHSETRKMVKVE